MRVPPRPQSDPSHEPPVGLSAESVRAMLSLGSGGEFPLPDLAGGPAPAEARNFGEYELLEKIATGGMGVVYKARHVPLNRVVALKMIIGGQFAGPSQVARFRREAEAAARLVHPNIVPIYEVGEHAGWHYFTMPFLPGGNLARAAARERFAPARAAATIETVARAIHHAHRNGVLHRDLKPNNILLDEPGEPHVTDFGLAKLLADDQCLTRSAAVVGTPAYMAPEQAAAGPNRLSPAADVYSLGAILYDLLTGRPPFSEATAMETLRRAAEEQPARPRRLNPRVETDLETIVLKCLEKDPLRRYATAGSLADDLGRWRRGQPVEARRPGRLLQARRWAGRNPAAAALLAVLFLGLVGTLAAVREVVGQREEKARLLEVVRDDVARDLRELWKDERKTHVPISAEKLAVLAGGRAPPEADPANVTPLVVAVHENDERQLVATATAYARLLLYLQHSTSGDPGGPVRPELRVYKFNRDARADLLNGRVHLARMGAHSYLLARSRDPGLRPLVREVVDGGKTIVFFTRRDTGIRRLEDLRGRSVAAGDVHATTSGLWAPAHLYRAGVTRADLRAYTFHDKQGTAMNAVAAGDFDAGVTGLAAFESRANEGLEQFAQARGDGAVWVGRGSLPAALAASFHRRMIALRDASVSGSLPKDATGFEPFPPEDERELEEARAARKAFFGDQDPLEVHYD